ncbi:polypeptide N-acetylgalactosaminyltransferase 13-like [Haliotis rufescens]|uniref:polypeptide N-acetylgalactosaminyltransferase 13-like n=1 Tax=Haliotis rufescens TaxID=6454 RepID=UPI001EB016D1|nr:polypeptide N-acetylgalactosaminyltransferase 13-like [Haliotis rufescens]XP_046328021.1 polypeptide N-acetylgalactosaminyltransferase 13-like [Haliotis rufescens]
MRAGRQERPTRCFFRFLCLVLVFWFLVFLQYIIVDEWYPHTGTDNHRHFSGAVNINPHGLPNDRLLRVEDVRDKHKLHRKVPPDGHVPKGDNSDSDHHFEKLRRQGFPNDHLPRVDKSDNGLNINKVGGEGLPKANHPVKVLEKDRKSDAVKNIVEFIQEKMAASDSPNKAYNKTIAPVREVKDKNLTSASNIDYHARSRDEAEVKRILNTIAPLAHVKAPGEFGRAVQVHVESLSKEEKIKMEEGFNRTGFNLHVSDLISLRRRVPDLRPAGCRRIVYPDDLPATSIVICFHNEAWSTLIRTVFSVLDNTPQHLLQEVILVDDASDHPSLGSSLEEYLRPLPKVKLVRASSRVGLIGARLLGVAAATAPVLTFLDSHVECMKDWLRPMLHRIKDDEFTVTYPVINGIDNKDFNIYQVEVYYHGLFNWVDLTYFPSPLTLSMMRKRKSATAPIMSPTMPGGIFSISRRYFHLLGGYDPGLKVWGGENIELSFKTWMCNGTVELLPCSHLAHIFRTTNPNLGKDAFKTVLNNAMRVAYVWMDEYKYLFFHNVVRNHVTPQFGDVSGRVSLRKKLQCKSFHWYMKEVATDLYAPISAVALNKIVNVKFDNYCLTHSIYYPKVWCGPCDNFIQQQKVWYLDNGQLLAGVLWREKPWMCLVANSTELVMSERCDAIKQRRQWTYTHENTILNTLHKKCIELIPGKPLVLTECTGVPSQKWVLQQPSYKLATHPIRL